MRIPSLTRCIFRDLLIEELEKSILRIELHSTQPAVQSQPLRRPPPPRPRHHALRPHLGKLLQVRQLFTYGISGSPVMTPTATIIGILHYQNYVNFLRELWLFKPSSSLDSLIS